MQDHDSLKCISKTKLEKSKHEEHMLQLDRLWVDEDDDDESRYKSRPVYETNTPSSCGPTPLMLNPRNVSGPPRKNWSIMLSFWPGMMVFITPADTDICTTCNAISVIIIIFSSSSSSSNSRWLKSGSDRMTQSEGGPKVLFETCVAMKFVDDDDDDKACYTYNMSSASCRPV